MHSGYPAVPEVVQTPTPAPTEVASAAMVASLAVGRAWRRDFIQQALLDLLPRWNWPAHDGHDLLGGPPGLQHLVYRADLFDRQMLLTSPSCCPATTSVDCSRPSSLGPRTDWGDGDFSSFKRRWRIAPRSIPTRPAISTSPTPARIIRSTSAMPAGVSRRRVPSPPVTSGSPAASDGSTASSGAPAGAVSPAPAFCPRTAGQRVEIVGGTLGR